MLKILQKMAMTGAMVGVAALIGLTTVDVQTAQAIDVETSNPMSGDEEAIASGQYLYRANCALCHGMSANGKGGRGLPGSADLRKFKRGFAKFIDAVVNGYKKMPPYGGMKPMDSEEIAQVGAYLETLAIRGANWADPEESSEADTPSDADLRAEADTKAEAELASAGPESQSHIDHVMVAWPETPGGVGLAQALEDEAMIAKQHAEFAIKDLEDMANMALHAPHVRHAVDPTTQDGGPGNGFGVKQAAAAIAKHIEFAAAAEDASDAVRTHAPHAIQSANNIVAWSIKLYDASRQIDGGASRVVAAWHSEQVLELVGWILNGVDANEDGAISWEAGEGGLAQIREHIGYMN